LIITDSVSGLFAKRCSSRWPKMENGRPKIQSVGNEALRHCSGHASVTALTSI